MFNLGTGELLGILLLALIIYGPDRLPQIVKKIAKVTRNVKRLTDDVSQNIRREVERLEQAADPEKPEKSSNDTPHDKNEPTV